MPRIIIPGHEHEEPLYYVPIQIQELHDMVRDSIEETRGVEIQDPIHKQFHELVATCYEADEIGVAATLLLVHMARFSGYGHELLTTAMELCARLEAESRGSRICKVCGCSELRPCDGGCSWVEFDLCSKCAEARSSDVLRIING
jgi:hypothetical protein